MSHQKSSATSDKADSPPREGDIPSRLVRTLFFPDAAFIEQKYKDHQRFAAITLAILAVYLTLLWGWDYFTDPIGARVTFYMRLAYLLILPSAIGIWIGTPSRRFLKVAIPLTMLLAEVLFVGILHQLDNGMNVGLGGFMYVMVILILVTQMLSLRFAIVCTLSAAALPQLMAAAGLAPLLPVASYGRLIWPATGLIILIQVAIAFHYLQRYELEQRLKLLSDTDELTGVRNRRYFMPLLEREVERAKRFGQDLSLLMLDIDRFKRINDAHGHPTGDLVIRRLADLCRDAVREIDVIARVGGEEFCVLLPGATVAHAVEVAERIRAMVETTDVENPRAVPLGFTVSIGVASLNAGDATGYDLFGRADTALYAAKAAGRNCVIAQHGKVPAT